MGVSRTHIQLVQAIANWVAVNCSENEHASILLDLPECAPSNKPFTINGYIPDMYIKASRRVLGEAKTRLDIETNHSRAQYKAYLNHLKQYENSIMVIAVPWFAVPQARSLINNIKKNQNAMNVKTIFIEKLAG